MRPGWLSIWRLDPQPEQSEGRWSTNRRHTWNLALYDADGQAVRLAEMPDEAEGIGIVGGFEVGRPLGLTPGTSIDFPMALSIPPLPLPAGQRFEWQLAIDDKHEEGWTLGFNTRPLLG